MPWYLLGFAPCAFVTCEAAELGADTTVSSPATANDHLLKLFEYDPSAPLDPQVGSSEKKEGHTLQQLTYARNNPLTRAWCGAELRGSG